MCGRYLLSSTEEEVAEFFEAEPLEELHLRYNIALLPPVPVICQVGSGGAINILRWGLVPFWAKDPSIGSRLINGRSETVLDKPSFREPFAQRRCLVPADGFYEWKKMGQRKQPFHFGNEIQHAKGHQYLTLVYQIDAQLTRLLWVGKERTVETLEGFFTMIGKELIELVCSDMWRPYLRVILRAHRELILNYFKAQKQFSSGVVEGLNNKAKVTMRKPYGFRTFRITELTLYHALGKLPEPELTHEFY